MIRRLVVAQLHTDDKDDPVITRVVIAGRPPKTYGTSMGDHTTAFTVHVNAVQLALEHHPLREAPRRMQDLVAGIVKLPGHELVQQLPMPQRRMWVEAYDRFITLHRALETASNDVDLGSAVQEYVGAYLELRELVPLSTINTAAVSTATAGKGKGEDVSALRAAAAGRAAAADELASQIIGSLDVRAVAMACVETRPAVLAQLAPALSPDTTPEQRAAVFVLQHLRSIQTAFPGAIAALAAARGAGSNGAASSSSAGDDRALARQRDDQVLGLVAQDLLSRVVYPRMARCLVAELPHLKQEFFEAQERSSAAAAMRKRKAADSVEADADPLASAAKAAERRYHLVCKTVGATPLKPPPPRADALVLSGRRMVKPTNRYDPAVVQAQHDDARHNNSVDRHMKRQLAAQAESPAPREERKRKDPLAIQVILRADGKVGEVRAAGRPPSPFSGTQGAHTTAWTVHLDRVRRLVVGRGLAEALAAVTDDLSEDRSKMVERLDNAFDLPARPAAQPVEVPQPVEEEEEEPAPAATSGAVAHPSAMDQDDPVAEEEEEDETGSGSSGVVAHPPVAPMDEDAAFGSAHPSAALPDTAPAGPGFGSTDLPDAVPLVNSNTALTGLLDAAPTTSAMGSTDLPDAVPPAATPAAAPAPRSLLLKLQAAIHEHLHAINAIPGATLPAANTGGSSEGSWRHIILEHLGLPPYEKRQQAHSAAEMYKAVVRMVDLSVLRADPDREEGGPREITIHHSKDPAARLIFQHLHAMEDSYPGVLAAAELTLPDDVRSPDVGRVLYDALRDPDDRRKVKSVRVKTGPKATDIPTVQSLDPTIFGTAAPHLSPGADDPFPATMFGNARWSPSLILDRDELAAQPTAQLLDELGNLRDAHLAEFARAFRDDIAVPGTYLAEGEGTHVAQAMGVHVDVYRDTPPPGFDVIDNVGRGDCLIYALDDIRRAAEMEARGIPRAEILARMGSAESRRLPVARIREIRALVRVAVPQGVIDNAVRSVVLDEVTGEGVEGLGPQMRKLLHEDVRIRGEIQAAASRRLRVLSEQAVEAEQRARAQARKGLPAPAPAPVTTPPPAATPAPASAPAPANIAAPVQAQLQFGSGPKLDNYALLHKGGNHYVALMRRD